MKGTKQMLLGQASALQTKRSAALRAVGQIETDAGLRSALRRTVYDFYQPTLELVEWKIQYLDDLEAEAGKRKAGNVV
jgi:hypothetical protein